jgi:hypothetical protein
VSRIYTSVVTVGNVNIYQVSGNPDGSLEAPHGSLAIDDAAALYQNTDGGTSWSGVGGGGYYQGTVILRQGGPVDAPNVYATADTARAALNAGVGSPQTFVVEQVPSLASVVLTAGTYGDNQTQLIGRPVDSASDVAVPVVYDDGVVLPMDSMSRIALAPNGFGVSFSAPIQRTSSLSVKSCSFTALGTQPVIIFSGGGSYELVCSGGLALLGLFGATIRLDDLSTSLTTRFEEGTFFIPSGGTPFQSTDASQALSINISRAAYHNSINANSSAFLGVTSFLAGGGRLRFYADREGRRSILRLGPGDSDTLPDIRTVPAGVPFYYSRDSQVGADATVNPAGSDVLLPADPLVLAQSTLGIVIKVEASGANPAYWITL